MTCIQGHIRPSLWFVSRNEWRPTAVPFPPNATRRQGEARLLGAIGTSDGSNRHQRARGSYFTFRWRIGLKTVSGRLGILSIPPVNGTQIRI